MNKNRSKETIYRNLYFYSLFFTITVRFGAVTLGMRHFVLYQSNPYPKQNIIPLLHKVHKYLEYHSVCPVVLIGTHHPLSYKRVSRPRNQRGGDTHSPAGEGMQGVSQFGRLKKKPSTLSTLCRELSLLPE